MRPANRPYIPGFGDPAKKQVNPDAIHDAYRPVGEDLLCTCRKTPHEKNCPVFTPPRR
ncbi:MAG TPA: hypothetical protein VGL34_25020 [Steroidobacteraceae bacterium]|jgi:hypothetical protein